MSKYGDSGSLKVPRVQVLTVIYMFHLLGAAKKQANACLFTYPASTEQHYHSCCVYMMNVSQIFTVLIVKFCEKHLAPQLLNAPLWSPTDNQPFLSALWCWAGNVPWVFYSFSLETAENEANKNRESERGATKTLSNATRVCSVSVQQKKNIDCSCFKEVNRKETIALS